MRYDSFLAAVVCVVSIACEQNRAPVIARVTSTVQAERVIDDEGELVAIKRTIILDVVASDPDGDTLAYDWRATSGELTPSGPRAVWTGAKFGDKVTAAVRDSKGGVAEQIFEYAKEKP